MADACRIIEVLDRHALAITQAGVFVKRKFCSLKEYPERFQQHRQTLLQFFPRQAQSTYQNVYTTFDVSAAFLAEPGQEKHLRALQLLNILGFMHLNQVSELDMKQLTSSNTLTEKTHLRISATHGPYAKRSFTRSQISSQAKMHTSSCGSRSFWGRDLETF
jgi:hypothetical protein